MASTRPSPPSPGARAARGSLGRALRLAVAIAAAVDASGCSSIVGEPIPTTVRAGRLCVERQPKDTRDLATIVAESLRAAGFDAYAGDGGVCADAAPYRVTYIDNWHWDMRPYLSRITIEVSDGATGEILGFGESRQDSLAAMGKTYRDVIDRAVAKMIGGT